MAYERKNSRKKRVNKYCNIAKRILFYTTSNTIYKNYIKLRRILYNVDLESSYDVLLCVSLPFYIPWAFSFFFQNSNLSIKNKLVDCGDPFSMNQIYKLAFYFRFIEKRVLRFFDYVIVPVENAVASYELFKKRSEIQVIPQGFNLNTVRLEEYSKNVVPTFAYAGLFYSKSRNPKYFFEYLLNLKCNYKFIIYTNIGVSDSFGCIAPYVEKLGERLLVFDIIPREELVKELSKVDFLINIGNMTTNQIPSKLIDYALTKRPILEISPLLRDFHNFENFIAGDYTSQLKIDVSNYDIRTIAANFLKLVAQ